MPLTAILFDKDGTLLDFQRTWGPAAHRVMTCFAQGDASAFERLAAAMHFDAAAMAFRASSPFIASHSGDYGKLWAAALARKDVADVVRDMDLWLHEEGLKTLHPIGDPLAVIAALAARGVTMGVATNDSEAGAHSQIAALGLTSHMAFVAGYDSGHGGKPGPGMVLAFAKRSGIAPAEIALVGDSTHDLHAARGAGAVAIAVLSGPASRDDLAPHADHVLEDIAALPALVDRLRVVG